MVLGWRSRASVSCRLNNAPPRQRAGTLTALNSDVNTPPGPVENAAVLGRTLAPRTPSRTGRFWDSVLPMDQPPGALKIGEHRLTGLPPTAQRFRKTMSGGAPGIDPSGG